MSETTSAPEERSSVPCVECGTSLAPGQDRETTDGGVFCRPCYNNLSQAVHRAVEAQGADINYPLAVGGALLGAAVGIAAWWGFTVLTNVAFGLVAIVIGFTVGRGILLATGNRRSTGLQVLSVGVAAASFFYATYLVDRTFVQRALAERGETVTLPFLPVPSQLVQVVQLGFGFMDVVFLAIVVYQAWKIPAPLRLPTTS